MAEKYRRFVDADTEINLEEDDNILASISDDDTDYGAGQLSTINNNTGAHYLPITCI